MGAAEGTVPGLRNWGEGPEVFLTSNLIYPSWKILKFSETTSLSVPLIKLLSDLAGNIQYGYHLVVTITSSPVQCMPCVSYQLPGWLSVSVRNPIPHCRPQCWRNESTKWRDETRSLTCSSVSPLLEEEEAAAVQHPRPLLSCPTVLLTPGRLPSWTSVTPPPTPRRSESRSSSTNRSQLRSNNYSGWQNYF